MREYAKRPAQRAKRAAYQKARPEENQLAQKRCRAKNPQRWMFTRARSTAKRRGLEWALVYEDVVFPTHCPVLGIELRYGAGTRREDGASFDRWDNSKGYVPGNVHVISWRANRIKWDCTVSELEAVAVYADQGIMLATL